jgi:hypothetical protein
MSLPVVEGWVTPSMEPPRVYAPRIEAAMDQEVNKQLELGVIEDWPEGDNMVPVHPVVKPDSD